MHVKYLKNIDYSSILYNHKSHNLQKIIHVIKIKNAKELLHLILDLLFMIMSRHVFDIF